jgi:exodeoxyribonuclease (lambda-induced)
MRIVEVEQGSPDWLQARAGVITASDFKLVRATKRTGEKTEAYNDLLTLKAWERLTGRFKESNVGAAGRRGKREEENARLLYQRVTGNFTERTGIVLTDCGRFGYSPDALVGDDGAIEIKVPQPKQLFNVVEHGDISEYMDQCLGGLWITERKWIDLVIYMPEMPAGSQLYIQRINRDDQAIAELQRELVNFDLLVNAEKDFFEHKLTQQQTKYKEAA